jgi:hypothetical protein
LASSTIAKAARAVLLGKNTMSIELSFALARDVRETSVDAGPATGQSIEITVAVVVAASAVLFVSFIAVMTGLT